MNDMERLQLLINGSDGIITSKQVAIAGIHHIQLANAVKLGKLERISHGIYLTLEAFEDKMFVYQLRRKNIIYSHDTALYLHEFSDREPLVSCVTVPTGYNTKQLISEGLTVFSIKKEFFSLGKIEVKTPFGRKIYAYNIERTLCDIIRNRSKMDISIITTAIKRYSKLKKKNVPLLMEYAKIFRVEKIIRSYMEVLL